MNSTLTHIGWVFYARKTEEDGNEFSGTTPEVAIRKLWNKYPELNGSEVVYQMPETKNLNRAGAIYDLDHCPSCKKPVIFIKATKANGRNGITILHADEDLPSDAEWNVMVVKDYKKELLRKLHKETVVSKQLVTIENTQPVEIEVQVKQETIKVTKPKVVMSRPAIYAAEVLSDRSIVEVAGLKHNRFAIIGKITSSLQGKVPDNQLKDIRSDLINHGKDLTMLMNVASRYAIVQEDGLPFKMDSGL
jgi:hypothetical protein